jgi:hypothetical protein
MDIYCRFAGDLFSKWYVPYTLISVVGGSIHYTRRQGTGKLTLRDALYILSYSIGSNIPFFLLLSLLFWLNIGAALVACFAVLIMSLLGYSQFLSYAPIQNFIAHDGESVEKKIMHSVFLVIVIGLGLLSCGYMAYFILL